MKIPSWLIKLTSVKLNCDDCGYQEKLNLSNLTDIDIDNLLGKKCPRCGYEMVNEKDIKYLKRGINMFHIDESKDNIPYGKVHFKTKPH